MTNDTQLTIDSASCEKWAATAMRLELENRKLREALQYIMDHHWVAGATPVKWINEFVDVAKKALASEYS